MYVVEWGETLDQTSGDLGLDHLQFPVAIMVDSMVDSFNKVCKSENSV